MTKKKGCFFPGCGYNHCGGATLTDGTRQGVLCAMHAMVIYQEKWPVPKILEAFDKYDDSNYVPYDSDFNGH